MSKLFKNNIMHNTVRTEVIFNNGKNADNGYVIKNPYATTQKLIQRMDRLIYLSIVLYKFFYVVCRRKNWEGFQFYEIKCRQSLKQIF